MCYGMGCSYENGRGECRYDGRGCYVEKKMALDRAIADARWDVDSAEDRLYELENMLADPDFAYRKPALSEEYERVEEELKHLTERRDDLERKDPEDFWDEVED